MRLISTPLSHPSFAGLALAYSWRSLCRPTRGWSRTSLHGISPYNSSGRNLLLGVPPPEGVRKFPRLPTGTASISGTSQSKLPSGYYTLEHQSRLCWNLCSYAGAASARRGTSTTHARTYLDWKHHRLNLDQRGRRGTIGSFDHLHRALSPMQTTC